MSVFGTAGRLCSWAKVAPRTVQSGRKAGRARTGRGNPYLKSALAQIATGAANICSCHPLPLSHVEVRLEVEEGGVATGAHPEVDPAHALVEHLPGADPQHHQVGSLGQADAPGMIGANAAII